MAVLTFVLQLTGATMLLLYAVRMVRTGVERACGPQFLRLVTNAKNPVSAAAVGTGLAILLQSSAAVTLLVAGFAASTTLAFGTGLSMVLGADLGSALLVKILSLRHDWLIPMTLAVGGILFLKTTRKSLRQLGRIVIGIALILIALGFLRDAVEPIRESGVLPAVATYLERDFLTAFIVGAGLAFVMHSSVAMILMCVTVVAIGALPVGTGVSLVLGANLGSALIPLWLSRTMDPAARRIPVANLSLRGLGAITAVIAVNKLPLIDMLQPMSPAHVVLTAHIVFNLALLVFLPLTGALEAPFRALLPDSQTLAAPQNPHDRSVLDETIIATPGLALACLRREVLRMTNVVEDMMTPVMDLYANYDRDWMRAIRDRDKVVNAAFDGIRQYAARMPGELLDRSEQKQMRELMEYAIALEAAGDIVARNLLPLAEEMNEKKLRFSDDGRKELTTLHARVLRNMALASNVLVSNDAESARLLLGEKDEMRRLHRISRKKHLKRLSEGQRLSLELSDIHLETASALKEFNSQIATVAYPILLREGQLLETRLITSLPQQS